MNDPRVLVVDDDTDIRETILDVLHDAAVEAIGAADGVEALAVLRAMDELPSVILLDLMMPGMDGLTFRAHQRADPVIAAIPVVMLSADPNVAKKTHELGLAGCLKKPLSLDALLAEVRRHLRG